MGGGSLVRCTPQPHRSAPRPPCRGHERCGGSDRQRREEGLERWSAPPCQGERDEHQRRRCGDLALHHTPPSGSAHAWLVGVRSVPRLGLPGSLAPASSVMEEAEQLPSGAVGVVGSPRGRGILYVSGGSLGTASVVDAEWGEGVLPAWSPGAVAHRASSMLSRCLGARCDTATRTRAASPRRPRGSSMSSCFGERQR